MKIEFKNKEFEILIDGIEGSDTMSEAIRLIERLAFEEENSVEKAEKSSKISLSNNATDKEIRVAKDRLPNMAKKIMCPNCHQQKLLLDVGIAYIFHGGDVYLLTDEQIEVNSILNSLQKDSSCKNIMNVIKNIMDDVISSNEEFYEYLGLEANNRSLVCPTCAHSDTAKNFIDCYISPYRFGIEKDSKAFCTFCGDENENEDDEILITNKKQLGG